MEKNKMKPPPISSPFKGEDIGGGKRRFDVYYT